MRRLSSISLSGTFQSFSSVEVHCLREMLLCPKLGRLAWRTPLPVIVMWIVVNSWRVTPDSSAHLKCQVMSIMI